MALEMRAACERCHAALAHDAEAFICSYECTFCSTCSAGHAGTCPNCRGELVARPRRSSEPRRAPEKVRHGAAVEWMADGAAFLDQRYSRVHSWRFDGGLAVRASASPHVVKEPMSDPAAVDPEEAFLAAIASCHMLWFLALAARKGLAVEHYRDEPYGSMLPCSDGRKVFAHVVLRPRVRFATGTPCTHEELEAIHHAAHRDCFLAGALRYPLIVEPQI
jgi:organic hydroperoxide reductase OsmC/OhrA